MKTLPFMFCAVMQGVTSRGTAGATRDHLLAAARRHVLATGELVRAYVELAGATS